MFFDEEVHRQNGLANEVSRSRGSTFRSQLDVNMAPTNFYWTEQCKYKLAVLVSRAVAYKKTEVALKIKWEGVLKELLQDAVFAGLNISSYQALQTQFGRMQDEICKKMGVTKEDVNLSGLEEPTDYEALMVDMMQENEEAKGAKRLEKEKKDKKQKGMLGHEVAGLAKQGMIRDRKLDTPVSLLDAVLKYQQEEDAAENGDDGLSVAASSASKRSVSSTSDSAKSSEQKAKRPKPLSWVETFANKLVTDLTDDNETIALDREERRQKLRHDEEEHELRMQERRQSLEQQSMLIKVIL